MVVQWVFRRGDERTLIDIVRTDMYYVVHVREPKDERWMTVTTALDAILRQADVERALTWGGWYLTDFLRSERPGQTCFPIGAAWPAGDALALEALSASIRDSAVHGPPPSTG